MLSTGESSRGHRQTPMQGRGLRGSRWKETPPLRLGRRTHEVWQHRKGTVISLPCNNTKSNSKTPEKNFSVALTGHAAFSLPLSAQASGSASSELQNLQHGDCFISDHQNCRVQVVKAPARNPPGLDLPPEVPWPGSDPVLHSGVLHVWPLATRDTEHQNCC